MTSPADVRTAAAKHVTLQKLHTTTHMHDHIQQNCCHVHDKLNITLTVPEKAFSWLQLLLAGSW